MRLVIGGAYQGKKEYVKRSYGVEEAQIWQDGYPVPEGSWRCVNGLHELIREMLESQQTEENVDRVAAYLHRLADRSPDIILICDEVGNGIIPMEKAERDYRECVGRVLCRLAEEADLVERVHCGIGQVIKRTVSLTLLRHGSTEGNLQKRYIGVTDEPLCSRGQADLKKRREAGAYPQAARVIASPMRRCLETAGLLYPEVTPEIYPEFRETDFGLFEGRTYEELLQEPGLRPVYQEWLESGGTLPFPQGESMEQMKNRCGVGFERLLPTLASDAVLIAHGGTIMSILHRYASPRREFYDYQCGNGEGYLCRVELTGDGRLHQMKTVGTIG
ncbi:MAG: bifunctional adenosylcobinamide kinase/adenosylcobinamide-phosphate guanylyltransferase [Clostridiales bacterium]|nr:bifunctional adenosylcobinamide kinase/adenosylcobinamide-phosphate guanylyltransferase [Clostridiales bacterium]